MKRLLLPRVEIIPAVCNGLAQRPAPHFGSALPCVGIRTRKVVSLPLVTRRRQGNSCSLCNIAHVHPGYAQIANGLWINAVLEHGVLEPVVVLEEVVWSHYRVW